MDKLGIRKYAKLNPDNEIIWNHLNEQTFHAFN